MLVVTAIRYEFRYPGAAAALYDSLVDDAFYATLEASASRDPAIARTAMLKYLDYSMIEAEEYGILSMHPEQLGAAIWNHPLDDALQKSVGDQKKSFVEQAMGTDALEAYSCMCANMHALSGTLVPEHCWYLSIVGIAPPAQGAGLGSRMIEDVLRQTDAAGIPTYLETFTTRNIPFYERLGYRQAGTNYESFSKSEYTVMLRTSRNQK